MSKLKIGDERINKIQDNPIETFQTEMQQEKKEKKENERTAHPKAVGNFFKYYRCIFRLLEVIERKQIRKKLL